MSLAARLLREEWRRRGREDLLNANYEVQTRETTTDNHAENCPSKRLKQKPQKRLKL